VLRGELHRVYPQIEEILKPLFLSLTLETLQGLNAQVVFGQKAAREVATDYLKEIGLLASK
jgi:osmoprotectant transport system substrate-binding protein